MIAMLEGEENAIELVRLDAAEGEAHHLLAHAEPAIDQQLAMIGRDQGGIPGAATPEHRQTKHVRYLARLATWHKQKANESSICGNNFDTIAELGYGLDDGRCDRLLRVAARVRNQRFAAGGD